MRRLSFWFGWLALASAVLAADPLPPKPAQYVTDRAGVLSAQTVTDLNSRLAEAETRTTNQVIVATFPKIPDGYAMEDFTQRTAEAWGVGRKEKDNGAVLFVFPNDRKLRIEVGYGLEGVLPDARAKRIISEVITPRFRAGDFNGGITSGVEAILATIEGKDIPEATGASGTLEPLEEASIIPYIIVGVVGFLVIFDFLHRLQSTIYGPKRRRTWYSSLGGSSYRSSGGSSGGGFSGGGGSFGGGGASGSW